MTNKSGIYKITNVITGGFYIGSTNNINSRFRVHRSRLSRNIHDNRYLQNSYNKHGADNFKFSTVLLCDNENKIYYEQAMIDGLKPTYNLAICAKTPGEGLRHSEEHKRKISEAGTGRKVSEETRRKIGDAQRGPLGNNFGKPMTEENKRKLIEINTGRPCSEETKRKLREAKKGVPFSDEHKRKLSEAHKGRYPSEETRCKLTESMKRRWAEKKANA